MLSGVAMTVVGVWLAIQAIGGNLAGRLVSWASRGPVSASAPSTSGAPVTDSDAGMTGTGGPISISQPRNVG